MSSPLKDIFNVRKDEMPLALLMSGYFFLVITSFWILKPIKKSLFIQYYDASGFDLFGWVLRASQAELLAKVLNMVVAFFAVVAFTWLARRLKRQQLTLVFSLFFMVSYALYSFAIDTPNSYTVWTFFLFGDLFSTLMVATFFAFLNDSVAPETAKRIYGPVGLGGVLGGVFGTTTLRVWLDRVDTAGWLWICFGLAAAIILVAQLAGARVSADETQPPEPAPDPQKLPQAPENPALEGAKLVFKSPYLLSIVGIVGLYEITSTIMDFQFTATIEHFLDGDDIGRQFSTVFTITNWVSMLVQLFLTSLVMTRFGLRIALLVLPVMVMLGSGGFLVVPLLWTGSLLNTADNGFSYSINQSAKEALYVPTTRDEKYKAKAFIDMFVQRFAKAIAVGISLLITTFVSDFGSVRYLSIVTVVVAALWMFAANYAGRHFEAIADKKAAS